MKPPSILPALSKRTPLLGAVRRGLPTQSVYLPARSLVAVTSRSQFNGYGRNCFGNFRGYATVPDKQWAQVIEKTGGRKSRTCVIRRHVDSKYSYSVQGDCRSQARARRGVG
jgi:hypothetical protein